MGAPRAPAPTLAAVALAAMGLTAIGLAAAGCDLVLAPRIEGHAPVIRATVPRATTGGSVTLTGVATDDYGVEEVRVRSGGTVDRRPIEPGRVVRFSAIVQSGPGGDSVTVEAVDGAGNVGVLRLAAPVVDTLGPVVRILAPLDSAVWAKDPVRIAAEAEDAGAGVAGMEVWAFSWDVFWYEWYDPPGAPVLVVPGARLDTVLVPPAPYLYVVARDSLGNTGAAPVRVFPDHTPPVLGFTYGPALLAGDTARFYVGALDRADSHWPGMLRHFFLRVGSGPILTDPGDYRAGAHDPRALFTTDLGPEVGPTDGPAFRTVSARLGAEDRAGNTSARDLLVTRGPALRELDAGDGFSCGLDAGGALVCWGDDARGQLGRGTPSVWPGLPGYAATTLRFAAVSAGGDHACALTAGGRAYCWGANGRGQLGDGTRINRLAPVAVAGDHVFDRLEAGVDRTCGIVGTQGYCWGRNERGQLGNGSSEDAVVPTAVATTRPLASIALGSSALYTCALTMAGEALCWGADLAGFNPPTHALSPVPVRPGSTFQWIQPRDDEGTAAFDTNGDLHWWPRTYEAGGSYIPLRHFTPPFTLGGAFLCEARPVGAPRCARWYSSWFAEQGAAQTGRGEEYVLGESQRRVTAGPDFVCALDWDGSAHCVGDNGRGQLGFAASDG